MMNNPKDPNPGDSDGQTNPGRRLRRLIESAQSSEPEGVEQPLPPPGEELPLQSEDASAQVEDVSTPAEDVVPPLDDSASPAEDENVPVENSALQEDASGP
ncbi:MAG TPA: hypothetical protein PJ988_03350, partial [Anaerolinea sp.]|nr:hypothetical protein [Anaerolinea sp.]